MALLFYPAAEAEVADVRLGLYRANRATFSLSRKYQLLRRLKKVQPPIYWLTMAHQHLHQQELLVVLLAVLALDLVLHLAAHMLAAQAEAAMGEGLLAEAH